MPSKKRRGRVRFSPATQGGRSQKKSLSSDRAENLADSNKGLILRPGAIAEGVERAAKHEHLVQGDQLKITIEEPLEDLEGPLS